MFKPSEQVTRGGVGERTAMLSLSNETELISLHKGEPSFPTPTHICRAAEEAIRQGYHKYPPAAGDLQLREAVAASLSQSSGLAFHQDDVLITNGATEAIYVAMNAYLDPGDEVLILDPCYSLYAAVAKQIGAIPVHVPTTSDFRLDKSALLKAIGARTKMLVINNPCNPTGIVFSEAEMQDVAEVVTSKGLLLLSDEVYDHIIFDNLSHQSALFNDKLACHTLLVNSVSKTFAMTGWRVGYLAALKGLAKPAITIHMNALGGVNAVAQRAALAALQGPESCCKEMLAQYSLRRQVMLDGIAQIPGLSCSKPQGTFYAFARFDYTISSFELTKFLLQHGVATRAGSEFGSRGEGFVRFTFAPGPEVIAQGMRSTSSALAALATGQRGP